MADNGMHGETSKHVPEEKLLDFARKQEKSAHQQNVQTEQDLTVSDADCIAVKDAFHIAKINAA